MFKKDMYTLGWSAHDLHSFDEEIYRFINEGYKVHYESLCVATIQINGEPIDKIFVMLSRECVTN